MTKLQEVTGVSAIEVTFDRKDAFYAFMKTLGDPNDRGEEDKEDTGLKVVEIYGKQDWQRPDERMYNHKYMYHVEEYDKEYIDRRVYFGWAEKDEYEARFFNAIEEKAKMFGSVEIRRCLFCFMDEELDRYTD